MPRIPACRVFIVAAALFAGGPVLAQGRFGQEAPDFPPGLFSDGGHYRLSDFRGKVVVLFFYESRCPRCKGSIPERNEVVRRFKDRPVKFFAVGAGDSLDEVNGYVRETALAMPVFVDSLGLMEARYGQKMSLKNIWQFRVIGPDGKIVDYFMTPENLEAALAQTKVEWKYKGKGYNPKLDPAIDAFEWGRHVEGMELLAPFRRSLYKSTAESAAKLYAAVRKEGEGWKAEADTAAAGDPLRAYDLYAKVAAAFVGDDLAKSEAGAMSRLANGKAVAAELAARKAFADLEAKFARLTPGQRPVAAKACRDLAKTYVGTPTADKAKALAEELGG
jgi:peroxiredoxin